MNLRDALIRQGPSLALQRAAQEEIARLDALLRDHARMRVLVARACRAGPEEVPALLHELEQESRRLKDRFQQAEG